MPATLRPPPLICHCHRLCDDWIQMTRLPSKRGMHVVMCQKKIALTSAREHPEDQGGARIGFSFGPRRSSSSKGAAAFRLGVLFLNATRTAEHEPEQFRPTPDEFQEHAQAYAGVGSQNPYQHGEGRQKGTNAVQRACARSPTSRSGG